MWRQTCYYYLKRNLSAVQQRHGAVMCGATWCNWWQKVQWLEHAECHMVGRMRDLQMNGKVPKVVASVLGFIPSLLNLTREIVDTKISNIIQVYIQNLDQKISKNRCVRHFGTTIRSTWSPICQSDKSESPAQSPLDLNAEEVPSHALPFGSNL